MGVQDEMTMSTGKRRAVSSDRVRRGHGARAVRTFGRGNDAPLATASSASIDKPTPMWQLAGRCFMNFFGGGASVVELGLTRGDTEGDCTLQSYERAE